MMTACHPSNLIKGTLIMDLATLKNDTMNQLYRYLQTKHPRPVYVFQTTNDSGIIELRAQQWSSITPVRVNLTRLPSATIQAAVEELATAVNSAYDGYTLYKDIAAQSKKLPGWWNVFSELRSLNVYIKALLANTKLEEIIKSDYSTFRTLISELNAQINKLMMNIEELKSKLSEYSASELEESPEDKQSLQKELAQVSGDFKALKEKYERLATLAQSDELLAHCIKLTDKVSSLNQELDTYDNLLSQAQSVIASSTREILDLRQKLGVQASSQLDALPPASIRTTPVTPEEVNQQYNGSSHVKERRARRERVSVSASGVFARRAPSEEKLELPRPDSLTIN